MVSFREQFPKASFYASSVAKIRLQEKTGLKFKSLSPVKKLLPANMTIYEPVGLKTGEVWLRFNVGKSVGWAVGDAFCGNKTATKETKVPELLGTFSSYGVEKKQMYLDWVLNKIYEDKPTLIIPCHGNIIRNTALPGKLMKLLAKL